MKCKSDIVHPPTKLSDSCIQRWLGFCPHHWRISPGPGREAGPGRRNHGGLIRRNSFQIALGPQQKARSLQRNLLWHPRSLGASLARTAILPPIISARAWVSLPEPRGALDRSSACQIKSFCHGNQAVIKKAPPPPLPPPLSQERHSN